MHIEDKDFTKNRMHTTEVQHVRSKLNPRLHVNRCSFFIKKVLLSSVQHMDRAVQSVLQTTEIIFLQIQ